MILCTVVEENNKCCQNSFELFSIYSLFSLFAQMAENKKLQDILLAELSDVNLFCKLIKYPSIRDNILKTFKVRSWFVAFN